MIDGHNIVPTNMFLDARIKVTTNTIKGIYCTYYLLHFLILSYGIKMGGCCSGCGKFCKDFRDFAIQGNVMDLAVGLVIGKAFGDLVQSFVNDLLLPPFGLLLGGVAFTNLTIKMHNFAYPKNPPVVLRYGAFIQHFIYLLVVAFGLFCIILLVKRLRESREKQKAQEYTPVPEPSEEIKVLMEIRDLLGAKTEAKA
ncbi:unnamed protein product [Rotaria socialis]|uniref:Large-conductance mechanosensitive channel n=1 Tax=Rotaria socialis TaxID=392032 RepID=A0A818P2T6_9BILA|nr:unnamed protein product [Rotaria socialis]CAF3614389.1 unnamed protein product [Rotaria socialis]